MEESVRSHLRIVLTGASSFTGAWFAATLARQGHTVIAAVQRDPADYPALEAARLAMVRAAGAEIAGGVSYGNDRYFEILREGCDVLGYHGADVRDYRSPDFDVSRAVASNLAGLAQTCDLLARCGGGLLYTGSVGEPGEGGGSEPERAMSPYGLSKGLTWQALAQEASRAGLALGKLVIPNPFGPLEQERFCTYLARSWLRGEQPEVRTPDYVRDNIPVDRLALAYARFVERLAASDPQAAPIRLAPSGYAGTQGDFTARFAAEIGPRLKMPAPFSLADQSDFSEPMVRINTDLPPPDWDETAFWDELAADYDRRLRLTAAD